MVPRSVNAFRTYGGLGFFHGGATLQELVIPVVVATWPAKASKVEVVLKPVGHIATGIAPGAGPGRRVGREQRTPVRDGHEACLRDGCWSKSRTPVAARWCSSTANR